MEVKIIYIGKEAFENAASALNDMRYDYAVETLGNSYIVTIY